MRVFFQIALLILYIGISDSSIYNNVAGTLSQYLRSSINNIKAGLNGKEETSKKRYNDDNSPISEKQSPPKTVISIIQYGDETEENSNPRNSRKVAPSNELATKNSNNEKQKGQYQFDHVLNMRRRGSGKGGDATSTDTESSSLEMREWKEEWKELWIKKKLETLNQTFPQGDVVNMVAARPWGVPCGDPAQHDMPWGTCMMAIECEPEYRIYRGDFQCGNTKFVCCAIQLTNYDLYQGFDASFAGSDLTTDSEEQRNRGKGSSERRKKKRQRERKRRRKARQKRKKKIKKNIKKIIREIRKILNKQYRNGTTMRKKKTKQLKKFIKDLKKKYKQDRKSVKNIHEIELVKIDAALLSKIKEIKKMNRNFIANATFRDIVVNGTINRQGARMLVEAYPELVPYFADNTRRTGDGDGEKDYDIEYGMLYY